MRAGFDIGADELQPAPVTSFVHSGPDWLGQATVFTNTTVSSLTAGCLWDFGDGVSSTLTSPVHLYASPGAYTVALTASSLAGSDVATATIAIYGVPTITLTTSSPDWLGQATVFTATAATVPEEDPTVQFLWAFGDGVTSTLTNPAHLYTEPGAYSVVATATNAAGSGVESVSVLVYGPPQAGFFASPLQGIGSLTVTFTNTTVTTPTEDTTVTYTWSFGDGEVGSLSDPEHHFSAPGIYTVTLAAFNAAGTDTLVRSRYISVYEPVHADFSGTPRSGVAPFTVTFTNTSTGDYGTCAWILGDGSTSDLCDNPTHDYTAEGVYTVTLAVSGLGGTDTLTKPGYITVHEPVVARFAADPTSGVAPLTVTFTNTSTGDYDTCIWDFGDGGTSPLCDNPTHDYTAAGVYTVTLAVSGLGGTDTLTETSYITAYEAVVAGFTADPTNGVAPLTVTFTNTSTGDYDTCAWDFGDGSMSNLCDDLTHDYAAEGVYTVTLAVSGLGGTDTLTETSYIMVYEPVVAGFVGDPLSGVAPLTVMYTNTSTGDYDVCAWDFGDSSSSNGCQDTSHLYVTPGVFAASLTISGAGGVDTLTRTGYITVYEPVVAAFAGSPTSGVAPLEVAFVNVSGGDYIDSLWDFGDGITSTVDSPTHMYSAAGVYTVSLTVSGPGGDATETKTAYITVRRQFIVYLPVVLRQSQ